MWLTSPWEHKLLRHQLSQSLFEGVILPIYNISALAVLPLTHEIPFLQQFAKRKSSGFLLLMSCFSFEAQAAFVAVEGKQLPGERKKHLFLQEQAQCDCHTEVKVTPWTQRGFGSVIWQ